MADDAQPVTPYTGVGVSSTFSTGMLTRLGQAIGALRVGVRRSRETVVVRVLGGTVLSFLVGAVLGGALLEPLGNAALVVPCVGLGVVTAFVARARPATVARRDG